MSNPHLTAIRGTIEDIIVESHTPSLGDHLRLERRLGDVERCAEAMDAQIERWKRYAFAWFGLYVADPDSDAYFEADAELMSAVDEMEKHGDLAELTATILDENGEMVTRPIVPAWMGRSYR